MVLPQAETFTPLETGYAGEAAGETVGYVFETTARGYGGAVRVMTGIDRTGTVTGVVLLEHGETPGLGANAERASFREQFEQAAPAEGLTVVRYQAPGPGQVEALTGATVTSRAVTAAVNEAIGLYYQLTGEGGGTP